MKLFLPNKHILYIFYDIMIKLIAYEYKISPNYLRK